MGTEEQNEYLADIQTLQVCPTEKLFKSGCELFLKKYLEPKYVQINLLMEEKYFNSTKYWCECYSKNNPSTNNGLEATNSFIKRQQTLRERLPLNIFLQKMKDTVQHWGMLRNIESPNYIS